MITCSQIISDSKAAFGTSGVRGLVSELNDATCFAYVLAFLDYLMTQKNLTAGAKVWVGHDLRPSSPGIAKACIAAIKHSGFTPVCCGEIPTPALASCALGRNEPAIMVTGSHIPFDRNGIKFYRADGEMMKEDEAPVVTSQALFPEEKFATGTLLTSIEEPIDESAIMLWRERFLNTFPNVLEGMRIGHFQHSAAGRDLLASLLSDLGGELIPLGRSNDFIPIDTEAVSAADKEQAIKWCEQHDLDLVISTDGDGDRPLLSDENGIYFRGDTLGGLAAISLKATVISTPVSSTTALEKSGLFKTIHRTKIGSPHVIFAMMKAAKEKADIVVGFEPNGGFLTASEVHSPINNRLLSALPTRDALLPILATVALARSQGIKLSQLSKLLPSRSTASDRLENTPLRISKLVIDNLTANNSLAAELIPTNKAPNHIDETDGLRMTFPEGDIVHLRPSGNAPELRIYCESTTELNAEKILAHARKVVGQMCAKSSI